MQARRRGADPPRALRGSPSPPSISKLYRCPEISRNPREALPWPRRYMPLAANCHAEASGERHQPAGRSAPPRHARSADRGGLVAVRPGWSCEDRSHLGILGDQRRPKLRWPRLLQRPRAADCAIRAETLRLDPPLEGDDLCLDLAVQFADLPAHPSAGDLPFRRSSRSCARSCISRNHQPPVVLDVSPGLRSAPSTGW
jgi:hypothetical protein